MNRLEQLYLWLGEGDVFNTLALILILLVARVVVVRVLRASPHVPADTRRRWVSTVKNTSLLLGALGLVFIWSPQLSTFALSLTAFAVALAITFKELLLCVVGAAYRGLSSPFSIGDWIEVRGLRGEVVEEGLLATRLLELRRDGAGATFTGRVISVPNSFLLLDTVQNETHRKRYLHHSFTVFIEAGTDPQPLRAAVLDHLGRAVADDPEADSHYARLSRRLDAPPPPREPRVTLSTTEHGKIGFVTTVFCATADAERLQVEVTELILGRVAKPAAEG